MVGRMIRVRKTVWNAKYSNTAQSENIITGTGIIRLATSDENVCAC